MNQSQSHHCSPMTGTAAVTEGTHCTPHPATTVAYAALWPICNPITTHAMTHPTGIGAPHLKLMTSPTNVTCTTIPWTVASVVPATLTTLHMDHSQ